MPEYRRLFQPGGTFFFTVVTHERRPLFQAEQTRECLGKAIRVVQENRPFEMVAVVLMPEHLHCLWRLPDEDFDFSSRWGRIKSQFTRLWLEHSRANQRICASRDKRHECGVWQRRFWEHRIRDEVDMVRHVNYIHYNPVKHGLVRCPHAWPHSSFLRWVEQGYYDRDWLCDCAGPAGKAPDWLRKGELFGE